MARGVLSGAIWGTVLSVAGLGTLSVLEQNEADQRDALAEAVRELTEETAESVSEVEQAEPEEAVEEPSEDTAAEAPSTAAETTGPTSEAEVTEVEEPASEPVETETEESAAPAEADATLPEPEIVAQPDAAPEPETFEPVDALASGEAFEPAPQVTDVTSVAPDANTPSLETPEVGTDANPDDVASTSIPAPETGGTIANLVQPETSALPSVPALSPFSAETSNAPRAQALDAPESEVGLNFSTQPAARPATPDPEVETEADTETVSVETPDTTAPARPVVRQLVPSTPAPDAADSNDETAAVARPAIGRPAGSLIDRNRESTSRLPTIGETSAPETAPTDAAGQSEDTRSPLERFAADVGAVDPSLPRMAIVLLDDGTGPLGPNTLENFPFPVTFALDPGQPDSATRMAAYRALGYEVATLANLPQGAQPTDVEQILAGALAAVPESVALIEAPGAGLQSDRASAEQTAAFVAESGHGLVFLPNGLNTAEAIARRENVPAVSILRDFDGEGQDARTKRRFLDGAAFRARQDGNVVMLGRLTPDTVSALLLWSLQDRASSVTMVPVSAILTQPAE